MLSAQELVHNADKRTLANLCLTIGYGVGGMLLSLIAYLVHDWNWIWRVIAICGVVYVPIL